jgi:heme exporter protein C
MRQKILYALGFVAALLIARNLFYIFLRFPDEAAQGAIFRIIFVHVPAAMVAFLGATTALVASIGWLTTRKYRFDSLAVSVTEVALAFLAANLITGAIWGRIIWGIWWTWDARLTSALVCWLLYAGYLMLRRAIEDPSQRATIAAVYSIFAFVDVPIVIFSIKWWRTQHPQPVFWGGGAIPTDWFHTALLMLLAMTLLGIVLTAVRLRQEETRREIDAMRRYAHAM